MAQNIRSASIAVSILLAALIVYTFALRYREREVPRAPDLDLIPAAAGGYVSADERQDANDLEMLGADKTLFRTYRRGWDNPVWLFIGYFGSQRENSQIHSPKNCYPGGGWNILEEGRTTISIAGVDTAVMHLIISDGAERQFVLYWFASADGIIPNEFALKWNQMKNVLLGRPQMSAFVRFSTILPGGNADIEARRALASLAEILAPQIDFALKGRGEAPAQRERTQ